MMLNVRETKSSDLEMEAAISESKSYNDHENPRQALLQEFTAPERNRGMVAFKDSKSELTW